MWTGRELVGWNRSGGAAYRPATNRWRRLAPAPFLGSAAWTGRELIMQSGDRATAFVPGRGWRLLASLPDPRERPTLVWDGRDDEGRIVARGVYLGRITASDGQRTASAIIKIAVAR